MRNGRIFKQIDAADVTEAEIQRLVEMSETVSVEMIVEEFNPMNKLLKQTEFYIALVIIFLCIIITIFNPRF